MADAPSDPFADLSILIPEPDRLFLRQLATERMLHACAYGKMAQVSIDPVFFDYFLEGVSGPEWMAVDRTAGDRSRVGGARTAEEAYAKLCARVRRQIEELSGTLAELGRGAERVVAVRAGLYKSS